MVNAPLPAFSGWDRRTGIARGDKGYEGAGSFFSLSTARHFASGLSQRLVGLGTTSLNVPGSVSLLT